MTVLHTKTNKELAVKALTWAEVVKLIMPVKPKLAHILKELNNNHYTFYQASYRFGDRIIADGKCYLPLVNGDVIELNDKNLPEQIKQDLSYNSATEDPLIFFLNRKLESYRKLGDKISSHALINPGQMIGIQLAVRQADDKRTDSALSWNLNAGSRTLFMLTPIGDRRLHTKLQEHFNMKADAPEAMRDHWQTFAKITNCANSPWRCEVIYFPRQLIKSIHNKEYLPLVAELNNIRHAAYNVWHNLSADWEHAFGDIELSRGLINYSPCALATAKHMFMIGADSATGFRPAINDDSAPVQLLEEAYANIYGLKHQKHSTVIMEPAHFDCNENNQPIYYSINYYVFRQNDTEALKRRSHIALLEEIRTVQKMFADEINNSHKNIKSLHNAANHLKFNYYHSNPEHHSDILNANLLAKEDERFAFGLNQHKEFPINSPFFKGCIRITPK